METGILGLNDLAPRIRELRARQDQLNKTRVQLEAEMVAQGVEQVNIDIVKAYAQDLRSILKESGLTERKAFLRSFVKRIEVNRKQVIIHYHLPMLRSGKKRVTMEVLPIVTPGGPSDPIAQPKIKTFFELSLVPADYSTININPPKSSQIKNNGGYNGIL